MQHFFFFCTINKSLLGVCLSRWGERKEHFIYYSTMTKFTAFMQTEPNSWPLSFLYHRQRKQCAINDKIFLFQFSSFPYPFLNKFVFLCSSKCHIILCLTCTPLNNLDLMRKPIYSLYKDMMCWGDFSHSSSFCHGLHDTQHLNI